MIRVSSKKDILKGLRAYSLCLEDTYTKNNEHFKIICDAITINDFCFRDVNDIHFNGNVMWINNITSIEVEKIKVMYISYTSINYDIDKFKIKYEK